MKKTQNNFRRNYLAKGILLFAYILLSSLLFSKAENKTSFADAVNVKAEQEGNAVVVSVKTSKDNGVQFYMFTIEGNLIKQLNITGSKKISIQPLEKGTYMYEFFCNDERLKSGKIELK